MSSVALLLYAVSAVNFALAAGVLIRSPKAEVNRVFSLTALSVAAWTLTNAVFQATPSVGAATLAANISYVSAIALTASLFHFSRIFPERSGRSRKRISPGLARGLWLLAALLCTTPFVPGLVIRAVELEPQRRILTNDGLYPISLFIFTAVVGSVGSLVGSLMTTEGRERMQARWVLAGMAVTAVVSVFFNLALPLAGHYEFVWLGPASSLIFVGSSVYSIVKERLFDIRIVIRRTLVYSALLAGIAGAFSLVEFLLTESLQHTSVGDEHRLGVNIGAAMVISFFFSPSKAALEKLANRVVFGSRHKGRAR